MTVAKKKTEVRPLVLLVQQAGELRELEFKQESVIIGSGPTSNVLLEHDSVSSLHAIIKLTADHATLIDLGSERGTLVNGKAVREQRLADGDQVAVGEITLEVQLPTPLFDDAVATVAMQAGPAVFDEGDKTVNAAAPKPAARPPSKPQRSDEDDTTAADRKASKASDKAGLDKAGLDKAGPDKTIQMSRPPSFETGPVTSPATAPTGAAKVASGKPPKAPHGAVEQKSAVERKSDEKKGESKRTANNSAAEASAPEKRKTDDGRLFDLEGRLSKFDKDRVGVATAALSGPVDATSKPSKDARVLQVSVYWGNDLLDVKHFDKPSTVTVGPLASNTIVLAAEGVPDSFTFIQSDSEGASIAVPEQFAFEARIDKSTYSRDELKQKGSLKPMDGAVKALSYRLTLNDKVAVTFGTVTVSAEYVSPAKRFASTLMQRLDQAFVGTMVFVGLFSAFFTMMVMVAPALEESSNDDLFKNSARFAKMILKDEQKKPKKFELSGSKGGGRHKDNEGKFGQKDKKQEDALASKKGAPKVDPNKKEKDRQVALNSGILGALKGSKMSAVSNVFGPGGLGTGINNALGGLRGTAMGDAGGAGGLGSRGAGPGGGGNSLGIGGLGNGTGRGTGGQGNVDLGGRGKGERQVEHVKTVVQGALSQEAIARVLDRAKSQMRYCYEKELQRIPDLAGKIQTKFVIGPSGGVDDANVPLTTMNNSNVEECVLRVIRRLRFPQPAGGGTVEVAYPLVYNPSGN